MSHPGQRLRQFRRDDWDWTRIAASPWRVRLASSRHQECGRAWKGKRVQLWKGKHLVWL